MDLKEHWKASGILSTVEEQYPKMVDVDLTTQYGYCLYVGESTNLKKIRDRLHNDTYKNLSEFVSDLRKPFIEGICYYYQHADYSPLFDALNLINKLIKKPYMDGHDKCRMILTIIQNTLPKTVFKYIKYPPSSFGFYHGPSWTKVLWNLEQHHYSNIKQVVEDLRMIGENYIANMKELANPAVLVVAQNLIDMFKDADTFTTWGPSKDCAARVEVKKYMVDTDVAKGFFSPRYYEEKYIPFLDESPIDNIPEEAPEERKKRFTEWKKWNSTKSPKDQNTLFRKHDRQYINKLKEERTQKRRNENPEFARWLSEYAHQYGFTPDREEFHRRRGEREEEYNAYASSHTYQRQDGVSRKGMWETVRKRFEKEKATERRAYRWYAGSHGCAEKAPREVIMSSFEEFMKKRNQEKREERARTIDDFEQWKAKNGYRGGKLTVQAYNKFRGRDDLGNDLFSEYDSSDEE